MIKFISIFLFGYVSHICGVPECNSIGTGRREGGREGERKGRGEREGGREGGRGRRGRREGGKKGRRERNTERGREE